MATFLTFNLNLLNVWYYHTYPCRCVVINVSLSKEVVNIKFVELFAGIGGFSLGFERAGMECVGHVEIDKYAQKVLKKHWPDVPLYSDVKEIKGDEFGEFELLCGGFPCQDISVAGKQRGIHGSRSSLFDEIIRIAGICRPRLIVLENVANLLSRPDWFGYVLGRIAEIGYDAEWEIISACEFSLPQRRERVWIVAYPTSIRWNEAENIAPFDEECCGVSPKKGCSIRILSYKDFNGRKYGFPSTDFVRSFDGFSDWVDRLKCLGNALVPQIAEWIGRRIIDLHK